MRSRGVCGGGHAANCNFELHPPPRPRGVAPVTRARRLGSRAMPDAARRTVARTPGLPAGGTVRPITRWGEPVMHRTQEPITAFDDELRELVADMVATMYAADGVGLAACQIGVDRSVFVFDCPDDDGVRHAGRGLQPRAVPARGQGPPPRRRRRGLPVAAGRVRAVRPPVVRPGRGAGARRRAGRVRRRPGCSPAASSTRPTTATAPCSATG